MVILALVPSFLVSVYVFGLRVISLTLVCVVASVFFEWAYRKLMKKPQTVGDLSAVVTGVLIAFNVPSGLPYWMAVLGCFVGIVIVKQLFGGIGKNIANPAITARIVLFLSFATEMTTWPLPIENRWQYFDVTTGATVLTSLKEGTEHTLTPLNAFLGNMGGSMGEVSAIALLIGFAFLLYKKVISWHIPVSIIATVAVFYTLLGENPLMPVLSGGLLLGAIFMATDYVTSPMSHRGMIVYGIMIGILTVIIRKWSAYPEGISFAILIMNSLTPLINRYFKPRRFGERRMI